MRSLRVDILTLLVMTAIPNFDTKWGYIIRRPLYYSYVVKAGKNAI